MKFELSCLPKFHEVGLRKQYPLGMRNRIPNVINNFSCSAQLRLKFIIGLLINVKMPTRLKKNERPLKWGGIMTEKVVFGPRSSCKKCTCGHKCVFALVYISHVIGAFQLGPKQKKQFIVFKKKRDCAIRGAKATTAKSAPLFPHMLEWQFLCPQIRRSWKGILLWACLTAGGWVCHFF